MKFLALTLRHLFSSNHVLLSFSFSFSVFQFFDAGKSVTFFLIIQRWMSAVGDTDEYNCIHQQRSAQNAPESITVSEENPCNKASIHIRPFVCSHISLSVPDVSTYGYITPVQHCGRPTSRVFQQLFHQAHCKTSQFALGSSPAHTRSHNSVTFSTPRGRRTIGYPRACGDWPTKKHAQFVTLRCRRS